IATGEVLHDARKPTPATDVFAFFDLHVPAELEVRVVLDNLSRRTAPEPVTSGSGIPSDNACTIHGPPPTAPGLNVVEGWFAQLTNRRDVRENYGPGAREHPPSRRRRSDR